MDPKVSLLNDLDRLHPLGTLTTDVITLPSPEPQAPDAWSWLPPGLFPEKWKWLELLAHLNLIRLTYKVARLVYIRVYIVPEDVYRSGLKLNSKGKDAVYRLYDSVNTAAPGWHGEDGPFRAAIPAQVTSLVKIYNSIISPTGSCTDHEISRYNQSILTDILCSEIPGLTSLLYPYQGRTVHRMLLNEISPSRFLDPQLIKIHAVKSVLYLDAEGKTWTTPTLYDAPRGGILGEEMGSGKTCEVLALILASLGQMPLNPASQFGSTFELDEPATHSHGLQSLQRCAAEVVQQSSIPWRGHRCELSDQCVSLLEERGQSYIVPPPPLRARSLRHRSELDEELPPKVDTRPGTRIRLSHATLVVVPDTLVSQWRHEIAKHVHSDVLRVLVIASSKKTETIPSTQELLQYDMVLISHSRFSREEEQIGLVQRCRCSYARATREIECTCPPPINYISPLVTIHWLRLVVDEGHSMSSAHTKAMRFAASLNVERRWVVSGTPSRGLVGASADGQEGMQDEKNDLEKISITLIEFLGLTALDKASWKRLVAKPFLNGEVGSAEKVTAIFNSVIVRNRQSEILKDVVLPPLTKTTVFLEATPSTILSQNIFNALIATNAVTSQREDQDYFFHKSQNFALQAIVRNMLQSTFYWTGTSFKDVEGAYNVAVQALKVNGDKFSRQDRVLLQDSIKTFEDALNSVTWLQTSESHELAYYLSARLPLDVRPYYAIPGSDGQAYTGTSLTMAQAALKEAMSTHISSIPFDSHFVHTLESFGIKNRARELKEKEKETRPYKSIRQGGELPVIMSANQKSPDSARKSVLSKSVPRLVAKRTSQLNDATSAISLAGNELSPTKRAEPRDQRKAISGLDHATLLASSDLASVRIRLTASAKLNYILGEVAKYSRDEKIIIFSDFVDHTFHLAEALDICGFEYLLYTSSLTAAQKSQYIMTFNTSDVFRVLIMDLHLAAHGLNLSSGSRVYFLRQVWSGAIESQAIKRAHRIGQTRPVKVKTLVLKGTIEEAMQQRRLTLSATEIGNTKQITDDNTIRAAIKNPVFMKASGEPRLIEGIFPVFFSPARSSGEEGLVPIEVAEPAKPRSSTVSRSTTPMTMPIAHSDIKPGVLGGSIAKGKKRKVQFFEEEKVEHEQSVPIKLARFKE